MGRRRTVNRNLPPHLYKRADGYYYRHPNGSEKRIVKGDDMALALVEWAKLEGAQLAPDAVVFRAVAEQWLKSWLPKIAPRTQHDYRRHLDRLIAVFGNSALDSITPQDVATYRDKRSAPIQANREIAVLSIMFGWAREAGYTAAANPCLRLRRNKETARARYLTDAEYDALYLAADQSVRDYLRLALLTGQRVADILSASRANIEGDELIFVQGKTGQRVRIRIAGQLKELLDELATRKRSATSVWLIQDDSGQRVGYNTLADRWKRTRAKAGLPDVRLSDIRPKVASDLDDMQRAQDTLGHRHISTTERHYRRKGKLVDPAK